MKYKQTTLEKEARLEGIGIHCGKRVALSARPAPAGTGRVFIFEGARIPALSAYAAPAARNTSISAEGRTIHTVEHVLSALSGLLIDNAEIELSAPEPPAMDGGALAFFEAFRDAGVRTLGEEAPYLSIAAPSLVENDSGATAIALPYEGLRLTFSISYKHPMISNQLFDIELTPETYGGEIAPARTYGFIEEVEPLLKSGLAKGASLDNAVVIYPDKYSCALRFDDEPVRHKAADMIGDLSLAGRRLRGHFIGIKSGHALNGALVRDILYRKPAKQ